MAHLLDFNKNTVQRIFQLKGWQVKKRPIGFRPRVAGAALGRAGAERALVDRPVPDLGRARSLDHAWRW